MDQPGSVANPALRLSTTERGLRFEVFAKPRARRSEVRGVSEGALEVAIAAPPVDGAANEELIRFLAAELGLTRKNVRLLRGEGSRTKLVEVTGLDADTILRVLGRP